MNRYAICFIKPTLNLFSSQREIVGLLDSDPRRFEVVRNEYPVSTQS